MLEEERVVAPTGLPVRGIDDAARRGATTGDAGVGDQSHSSAPFRHS